MTALLGGYTAMPVTLDRDDRELVNRVAEDLEHIAATWTFEMSEASLRRECVVLRRILNEDEYGRAWRALNFPRQPLVRATTLSGFIGDVDPRYIAFALAPLATRFSVPAGGQLNLTLQTPDGTRTNDLMLTAPAYTDGLGVAFMIVPAAEVSDTSDVQAAAAPIVSKLGGKREWRSYWLSEFLDSPSGLVNGITVRRRDVIGFVANKLGGAHGGSRVGVRDKPAYGILENQWGLLGHLDVRHLELLSIGQFIGFSTDAYRFIEEARRLPRAAYRLRHDIATK